jgi:uncharacterized membrane protein YfcA
MVRMASDTVLTLLFGAVSLLYSMVGQAGGTSFLAVMAFASFSPNEMRPTALLLNVVTASYSTWRFHRGDLVKWAQLAPLLIASLPTALVGGLIVLNEHIYKAITGLVFLLAAMVLAFGRTSHGEPERSNPLWAAAGAGAVIGFVSGLTGVGGGVFFAPLLIACTGQAQNKQWHFQHPTIWQIRLLDFSVSCMRDKSLRRIPAGMPSQPSRGPSWARALVCAGCRSG